MLLGWRMVRSMSCLPALARMAQHLLRLVPNPAADNACHLSCCNPPLKRVPKGDWFCVECVARQQAEAAAAAAKAK